MFNNHNRYHLLLGRHCSVKAPDYLAGAIKESLYYNANCLQIHSGSPQNSFRLPISQWKVQDFKNIIREKNMSLEKTLIVHGPYLVNLANLNNNIFSWSVKFLIKEILRMEEIGADIFIIHPGTNIGGDLESSIIQISNGLNYILSNTSSIKIALETTAKKKNEVGWKFENIQKIINKIEKKNRIGVCWDTCHLYSVGYDIKNNLNSVIEEFNRIIGIEKLLVIHINDSKTELGSNKDRHENLGRGKIGFKALRDLVFHPKFNGLPKILETPRKSGFENEINLLIHGKEFIEK